MAPKWRIFIVMAVLWTVLDQLTKILIRRFIELHDKVTIIPGLFNLWHRDNPGAAWGILGNNEYRILIFSVITVLASIVIVFYVRSLRPADRWLSASLGLITAGALGNFIDRIVFGRVTDFLDVYVGWDGGLRRWLVDHVGTNHYNTFNIADSAIVIGVIMFAIHVIFLEPRSKKRKPADESS